jgi:hypothetical protein
LDLPRQQNSSAHVWECVRVHFPTLDIDEFYCFLRLSH